MMVKVTHKETELIPLLSLAISKNKAESILEEYIGPSETALYAMNNRQGFIGCIGITFTNIEELTILHLAVSSSYQGQKIASKMIDFIMETVHPTKITAETDNEAVGFYQKYGFEIRSLGEKYPAVERFHCSLITR